MSHLPKVLQLAQEIKQELQGCPECSQLEFTPSFLPAAFIKVEQSCPDCFLTRYSVDRDLVKNVCTRNELYRVLNHALCHEKLTFDMMMFAALLSRYLWQMVETLPDVVYRGVNFDQAPIDEYAENIGQTIYFYGFTSTSTSMMQALEFGECLLTIHLVRGKRDYVACIEKQSQYKYEREVLIAANAGFEILSVSKVFDSHSLINLELVDESHCMRTLLGKQCHTHSI